jgi:hypothetical protein
LYFLGEKVVDQSKLLYKIALSSDNKKLGRIIRFDKTPGKTIKKLEPIAILQVVRAFKSDINIAIELNLLNRIEEQYARFKITRKEFDQIVKIQRRIRRDRERKAEYIPDTPFLGSRGGYGYHRKKNRRK